MTIEPSKTLILSLTYPTGFKASILIDISKMKILVNIVFALVILDLHVHFCLYAVRERQSIHHHGNSIENHSDHNQIIEGLTVYYP